MTSDGPNPNVNDATESGQGPSFVPESPDQQRTHDDILRVLSDFQSGLHSLKSLHAQRQELQRKLIEREVQLAEREGELTLRNAQLQSQQADFEEVSARFAQQARDLDAKRTESEAKALAYEAKLREIDSSHQAQLSALRDQLAQAQQATEAVPGLEREHALMRETIAARAVELQDLADRIASLSQEAGQLRASLGAKEAEAARLRSELDLSQTGLAETKTQSGVKDEALHELRAHAQGLLEIVREYEDLWGIERRENATLAQRVQDAHAAHQRREAELEALRASAGSAEEAARLKAETAQLQEESEALKSEAARLREETANLKAQAATLQDQSNNFQTEASSAQAQAQDAKSEAARLKADLTELESTFETLRARLKDALAARESADSARGELEAHHTELTGTIQALQAEVASLKEHQELTRAPRPLSEHFVQRRKQRLKAYRAGLRRQVTKVKKASDALSKRYEQCELVLSQRAELAEVRSRVLEAERRVMRAKSRTRVGVVLLCSVLTFSVIGAMSWVLAREVAPAMFLAESTLKADGRGRDLNEAELEEWRRFHVELLADPRFHEAAAERFARQGLPSLSTPAAVSELVNTSVSTDSTSPEELRLTLKAQGRDRTRRELEVLTASVASYANAAQQRRIDGGATLMPDPVKVGSDAIDQTQMYWALAMMGAGVTASGLLALMLWNKLVSVKTSFEQDSRAAELLDAASWAELKR